MLALFLVFAALALWRLAILLFFSDGATPDEVRFATTADGWKLALSHYRSRAAPRRSPVLLCHGLAADRHSFDADPTHSLAHYLAALGFDVWSLELRGHGFSDGGAWFGARRWGWDFDAYLDKDLPAAIEAVLRESRAPRLHLVGHSMGGILTYAHLARGGERVQSATVIGSGLDYGISDSRFRMLFPLRWTLRVLPFFPFGTASRWYSPLAARLGGAADEFSVWPANIEGPVFRRFLATGIHNVSSPVLAQLTALFDPGGLRSRDGTADLERLPKVATAILALAGDKDRQCPPEAARAPIEAGGAGERKLVMFGKDHGQPEHYGHVDLLLGKRAGAEVFPVITDWLVAHDA